MKGTNRTNALPALTQLLLRSALSVVAGAIALSGLAASARVEAGEEPPARGDTQPKLVMPPNQYYPVVSRRLGETGRVLLEYRVGPNARPQKITVLLADSPHLEAAAIRLLEDALIEPPAGGGAESEPKPWEVAVLFELDMCQKLTSPNPEAAVVRICGKRSVLVADDGSHAKPGNFEPPPEAAVRESTRKAEKGDLDARRWLCTLYAGWKVKAGEHPEHWCEIAAQDGDIYSAVMLADLYYEGRGVTLDYARAFQLYQPAAARGMGLAQMMVGAMYVLGRGVNKDQETGLVWLERSMEDRHPPE